MFIKTADGDIWVAQSVKRLTLDFGSGEDLRWWDGALSRALQSAGSVLEILSPSPFAPPPAPAQPLREINK